MACLEGRREGGGGRGMRPQAAQPTAFSPTIAHRPRKPRPFHCTQRNGTVLTPSPFHADTVPVISRPAGVSLAWIRLRW